MSKICPKRLAAICTARDDRFVILRAASDRAREAKARLASARAARQANTAQLEATGNLADVDRLKALLKANDEQISALDAVWRDAADAEARLSEEWRAAAALAEACERHAARNGLTAPPPVIVGPRDYDPDVAVRVI